MEPKSLQVNLVMALPELVSAVHIAALGFHKEESTSLAQDVESHLHSGRLVYSIFVGLGEIGFAIFEVYGDILYLSGIIIVPDFQGCGIAQLVVEKVKTLYPQCKYLALRTQSLRMYLAAAKMCEMFYPALDNPYVPVEFSTRGTLLAKTISSQFPVHVGCYGGPLYGDKPSHRDESLQNRWDKLCDFERGDAVLFIGSFP